MDNREVIVVGAGGHGAVVADILRASGRKVKFFLDSNQLLKGEIVHGSPCMGIFDRHKIGKLGDFNCAYIIAIGDNLARAEYGQVLHDACAGIANAIHPTANISETAFIPFGKGVVVCQGANVCAEASIGPFAIINTAAIVEHGCKIGRAAHICPGAKLAGGVTVEDGAFVGIGAVVKQNIRIGAKAVIGAGAVVTTNVSPGTTVVGVPARNIDAPKPYQYADGGCIPYDQQKVEL